MKPSWIIPRLSALSAVIRRNRQLSCSGRDTSQNAAVPSLAEGRIAKDFIEIGAVGEPREFGIQTDLFGNDDFFGMVAEQIEEVRIMCRGDDLDRLAFFVGASACTDFVTGRECAPCAFSGPIS